MRVDLRVKHDIEARRAAIGLFERGHGYKSAAKALSVPRGTVRQWLYVYRSFGSEVLLSMDGKQARYTYEQRVAAASAVVDGGMTRAEAMAAFGIMSMSPLKKWCALYRRGGAEALRPRPKGRPSDLYRLFGHAFKRNLFSPRMQGNRRKDEPWQTSRRNTPASSGARRPTASSRRAGPSPSAAPSSGWIPRR